MSQVTEKTFSKVLAATLKSATAMRSNIQALIVFGMQHYAEHRNAAYLSSIVNKCIGVKALPTQTIKEYIKAHSNLHWVKLSDGTHGFKMNGDNPEVKELDVSWYDWEGGKHNKVTTDMDFLSQIKSLQTRITKALSDGHIKEENREKAQQAVQTLGELLA